MAGLQIKCLSGKVLLATGAATTLIQVVAPVNQCVKPKKLKITFDGATSTNAPARVRILRQTSAGSFTTSTNVPAKVNAQQSATVQTNYQVNATAEPTNAGVSAVVSDFSVATYQGTYVEPHNFDEDILINNAERWGLEVTAPNGVNVWADWLLEE